MKGLLLPEGVVSRSRDEKAHECPACVTRYRPAALLWLFRATMCELRCRAPATGPDTYYSSVASSVAASAGGNPQPLLLVVSSSSVSMPAKKPAE